MLGFTFISVRLHKNHWMDDEGYNKESFSDFPGKDVEGDMGWTGNKNWETSAEITAVMHATVRGIQLVPESG